MRGRSPSISLVEAQYDVQRHSVQGLALTQLSLDPILDMEEIDATLKARRKGTRPGVRVLLNRRREAMRALAAQLAPTEC